MKTFTVEGHNWAEDYQVDPTLFDNYEDMAFEAMTQALEEYVGFMSDSFTWHSGSVDFKNDIKRWGDAHEKGDEEIVELGWTTIAYEKGCKKKPDKKVAALTEFVLRNAGHHEFANEIRVLWDKETLKKGIK